MAKFPIQYAPEKVQVRPTAVRANLDVDTGEGEVYEAMGKFGGTVGDLGEKWDLKEANTQFSAYKRTAQEYDNKMRIELASEKDPNKYGEIYQKYDQMKQRQMPTNQRAIKAIQIWNNTQSPKLQAEITKAQKARVDDNLKAEIFQQQAIVEQTGEMGDFESFLNRAYMLGAIDEEDKVKTLYDTQKKAVTGQITNLYSGDKPDYQAARDLTNATKIFTPQERESILKSIDITENRKGTVSEKKVEAVKESLYQKIMNNEPLTPADLQTIQDDPDITDEDSNKAIPKIIDLESKWNQHRYPLTSNSDVYDKLTVDSELVERGTKSPAEWEEEFAEALANGYLSEEDKRTLRSKDIVATKTMQNSTFTQTTTDQRASLVEATESEIKAMITARDIAVKSKDLGAMKAFEKALQKSQIQKWNYGRYRTELRSQINQNPEWSQKQIFTASQILIEKYDKPLNTLIKEFDSKNPDNSISQNPPDDEFKDIWKNLSQDDKAKVWEARMLGASVQEITGELPK